MAARSTLDVAVRLKEPRDKPLAASRASANLNLHFVTRSPPSSSIRTSCFYRRAPAAAATPPKPKQLGSDGLASFSGFGSLNRDPSARPKLHASGTDGGRLIQYRTGPPAQSLQCRLATR